jgi:Methyltransferase FkbM domain
MNLKDGIKMMASSDPKEVIAFHMKSTQEVVCPAELIEELTIAKNEGRHEVLLDIGSNIGSCAVIALKLGHSVLAFEPGAENVHLWRENILLNRDLYPKHEAGEPRQFAILLPYAVAEKVSELALLLDPANAGNAMVLDLSRGKSIDDYFPGFVVDQANMIEKVCILSVDWLYTTLRRYDKAQGPQRARALSSTDADEQWAGAIDPGSGILPLAGISRYLDATSIIKIDIQGHEFKAFKGMAKFLKDQTKSYIRRKEAENGGKQYEMALRKVRSDESITAGLPKQPMLAPPPTPAEPRSPGLPPLPLAYGHLRSIFFELSMEIVFRKGDQPDQVHPWLLEKGYGITVEHDRLIPKGEFEAMVDLSPNGHDHNPSANLDLIAKRMDMLYASGV